MAQTTPVHSGYTIINGSTTGSNGSKVNTWIEYKITSQNIENNTSTLNVYLYARANTSGLSTEWNKSNTYGSIVVNGTTYSGPAISGYSFKSTSTYNLMAYKEGIVITHNTDGTKSINVSGTWNKGTSSSTYITGGSVPNTSVTLTTIPRASSFTCDSTFNTGEPKSISISRASTSFTHKVTYSIGNNSATLTGQTTSASVNFPASWLPSATTGTGTITVYTYNGTTQNESTLIGSSSKTVTVNVPSSMIPTMSVTYSDAGGLVPSSFGGIYVAGKSKFKVTISNATAGSGSSISSYYINAGGTTGSSNTLTTGWLTAGTKTITAYVKDARGRQSGTYNSGDITVYAYSNPTISNVSVFRCNSGGTASDTGTYISIKATASCSSCNGKNSVTLKYRIRNAGGTWGSYVALTSGTAKVVGTYVATNNYEVEIIAYDAFGSESSPNVKVTRSVPSSTRIINIKSDGKGIAFGGFSTVSNAVEINNWNFILNGHKVTIGDSAPSSPSAGDIWIDIS